MPIPNVMPDPSRRVSPCRVSFRRPSPRRTGFSLVEIAIAMFVFGMILVLLGAIFPVATRAGHVGGNYAEASFLAQHKIDQLRNLGAAKLDAATLAGQGVVDTNNGAAIVVPNPAGLPASMVSYSFTLTDNLVDNTKSGTAYPGFFPAGSTGILSVGDYHDLTAPNNGTNVSVPATVLKSVTVTITWAGPNQGNGTLTTHTAMAPA